MALEKQKTLENGSTFNYHRVNQISIIDNGHSVSTSGKLVGYSSKAIRDVNGPLGFGHRLSDLDFNESIFDPSAHIVTFGGTEMSLLDAIKKAAYLDIKSAAATEAAKDQSDSTKDDFLASYDGSVDVLE